MRNDKINIEDLLNMGLPVVNEKRYWFLRTNSGEYFDDFYFEGHIAIGWDKVSDLDNIKRNDCDRVEGMIRQHYPNEKKPGYIAKQIKRFTNDMNIGDIVLIPSRDSKKIAFGEITSEVYKEWFPKNLFEFLLDEDFDKKDILEKRRNVTWLKVINRNELDPYLYRIIYSHNTIVDAKPYEIFINRALYPIYIKDDKAYINFRVNKREDVGMELINFAYSNVNLIKEAYKMRNLEFNEKDIQTKINVQCPGDIQFVGPIGAILVIAFVGTLFLGGDVKFFGFNFKTDGLSKEIREWYKTIKKIDAESENVQALQESSDELQIGNTNVLVDNTTTLETSNENNSIAATSEETIE